MTQNSIQSKAIVVFALVALISCGVYFRFVGVDWNQSANLHPDEYGLTNTLTQLTFPRSISDYFNTRLSPISPYQKYDLSGQVVATGPDNSMRWGQWPIILIRGAAEVTHNTGYDDLRIMGRQLSALLDTLTLLLIFFIGWTLYGLTTGLLAAALSSLAVLQIQQSHFMTVDSFATFFAALAMLAAVIISRHPPVKEGNANCSSTYQMDWRVLRWYVLFGVALGMTVASKINLLPLAGMVPVAAFISIADLRIHHKENLRQILESTLILLLLSVIAAFITFRICQPMSFRAPTGDTSVFTFHLNQDWVASMKIAQQESSGAISSPPAEQWTDRAAIIFPWINMVVWGMGIPLGLVSWIGFFYASWETFRSRLAWKKHFLLIVWVGGYFLFMATRWVKSMRYFLPIYPFLCLLAAWLLIEVFHRIISSHSNKVFSLPRRAMRTVLALLPGVLVLGGTFIYASAFVHAVYGQDNTRIQATKWVLQNIPAPIQLQVSQAGETFAIPISVADGQSIDGSVQFQPLFSPQSNGKLTRVVLPHVQNSGDAAALLTLTISTNPDGKQIVDQSIISVPISRSERGEKVEGVFSSAELEAGKVYTLTVSSESDTPLSIYRNVIAAEDWDESVPVRFDGIDPFGQYYQGVTMQVRWPDVEEKRAMYTQNIEVADYIILSSQRSIWSICRLPLMYPLTIEYYRALFDGQLGFDQVTAFQAPIRIGPLQISDLGGTAAWYSAPSLPLFNFNPFAAEEAFSVYDHAPVWIFAKQADFSSDAVSTILRSVDLNKVQIQYPKDTKVVPIR